MKMKVDNNPKKAALHRRIQTTLMHRYDTPVMNNVYRSDYVECLVMFTLGDDWWLTWTRGWDWAAWDCQHTSGVRLEVKQAAARQSWDRETPARHRAPRFDTPPHSLIFSPRSKFPSGVSRRTGPTTTDRSTIGPARPVQRTS